MCDENIMKLSAFYIDDILKCYKSLRDIAETFPLQFNQELVDFVILFIV